MKTQYLLLFLVLSFASNLLAAPLKFVEQNLNQPDGTPLNIYASGDEYYHWLHDKDGYTIVQDTETGFFVYAKKQDGKLLPTKLIPGIDQPESYGLKPWMKINSQAYKAKVQAFSKPLDDFWKERRMQKSAQISYLHRGDVNNILVFITFKKGDAFKQNLKYYNNLLNKAEISLNSYYKEVSYEQLNFTTHFYPSNTDSSITLSYEDLNTRDYYRPYTAQSNPSGYQDDNEKNARLQALLKNALESIQDQVPSTLELDKDRDGFIDNISFVVQGNPDGWNDLIWPHRYALYAYKVIINNAQARYYTFQMENTTVKTFCHEMFHMLGAPDLYHYDEDQTYLEPVGDWDLMESGFGHMGAYMKYKYSIKTWIKEIPEITSTGTYSLHPVSTPDNNAFIIYPPAHYGTDEFFVLEYRKKDNTSYERNLKSSGLLLYRIKPSVDEGNKNGPPDEVYIYRPNGAVNANGDIDKAALQNINGVAVQDNSIMSAFFSDGSTSGLKISDVSVAGDSITFFVDLNLSSEANIHSFNMTGMKESMIDSINNVIYIKVERETNLTSARPTLSISEFAVSSPASNEKIDLLSSPYYTVTAQDGTIKEWKIEVEVLPNTEANFTSFAFKGLDSKEYISITNQEVIVKVPYGTSLKNLTPTANISLGAHISPDTLIPYDFTVNNVFTIVSEDLLTTKQWHINVQPDEIPEKYSLNDLVNIYSKDGFIYIESYQENLKYEIFALHGALIANGNLDGRTSINVFGKQGIYLIRVSNAIGTVSGKIRVQF